MARSRTVAKESQAVPEAVADPPGLSKAPMLAPPRRRRRPALLALAVALVILGALGATFVATSLVQTSSVIAVARGVAWGETLQAADVVEARIAADPALSPIPYAELDSVVGMVAATDLTAGSLLTRDALTVERFPPPGVHLVGVAVTSAQLPVTPLQPGDEVLLVPVVAQDSGVPADGAAPAQAAPEVEATVARVGDAGVDRLRVVDVLVDAEDGPDVAARAAAGLLVIVIVPSD